MSKANTTCSSQWHHSKGGKSQRDGGRKRVALYEWRKRHMVHGQAYRAGAMAARRGLEGEEGRRRRTSSSAPAPVGGGGGRDDDDDDASSTVTLSLRPRSSSSVLLATPVITPWSISSTRSLASSLALGLSSDRGRRLLGCWWWWWWCWWWSLTSMTGMGGGASGGPWDRSACKHCRP